eukprot:GEMP01006690.1.p1 GENE.GEMP01006690.1~~GEMP01006690.1.p1  ORF type:complete len:1101 (+),score=227.02 GEMP01006690.1:22-3303(+)
MERPALGSREKVELGTAQEISLLLQEENTLLSPNTPSDWIDTHLSRFLAFRSHADVALRRYCAYFIEQLASQKPSKSLQILPTCTILLDDGDSMVQKLAVQAARVLFPRAMYFLAKRNVSKGDAQRAKEREEGLQWLERLQEKILDMLQPSWVDKNGRQLDDGVYIQVCYFVACQILIQTSSPVFIRPTTPCELRGVSSLEDLPMGTFDHAQLQKDASALLDRLLSVFETKVLTRITHSALIRASMTSLSLVGRLRVVELKTILHRYESIAKKADAWVLDAMGDELLDFLLSSVVSPLHYEIVRLLCILFREDLPVHAWVIRAQKLKRSTKVKSECPEDESSSLMIDGASIDIWDGDKLLGSEKVIGADVNLQQRKVDMPGHVAAMALVLQRDHPQEAAKACLATLHSALPPMCPVDKEGLRVVTNATAKSTDTQVSNDAFLPKKRVVRAEAFVLGEIGENFDPRFGFALRTEKKEAAIPPIKVSSEHDQCHLQPLVFKEILQSRKRRRKDDGAFNTVVFEISARMASVPSNPTILRQIYEDAVTQVLQETEWQRPAIKMFYSRLMKDEQYGRKQHWPVELGIFNYASLMDLFLTKYFQKTGKNEFSKELRVFINELPKAPPIIFDRLEEQCLSTDGENPGQRRKMALMTILSLIESFADLRVVGLRLLIRLVYYNKGPDAASIRNDAMRFIIGKVYKPPVEERPWQRPFKIQAALPVADVWPVPLSILQGRFVEDAAVIMLRSIAPKKAGFTFSIGATKDVETVCDEVLHTATPIAKEDRLWLYLALCIKRPVHIHGLIEVFAVCEDSLKNHLVNSIEEAIKHMSSNDNEILSLVENAAPATQTIILKVLSILSASNVEMNPAFGPAVVGLYKKTKNAKLLVPVAGVLDRESVLDYLPNIIQLEPGDVSMALKLLVTSKTSAIGASELLTELHHFNKPNDDLVPVKYSMFALNQMLQMMDLFDSKVYGIVLQSIVEDTGPLPTLFMRTVIQLVKELPSTMADLVAQEILPRLIRREGFLTDARMWRGMMMVLSMTQPKCPAATSAVLAMLPQTQLEDILVQHPEWKAPLREFVQKQPRESVLPHVRSVLALH